MDFLVVKNFKENIACSKKSFVGSKMTTNLKLGPRPEDSVWTLVQTKTLLPSEYLQFHSDSSLCNCIIILLQICLSCWLGWVKMESLPTLLWLHVLCLFCYSLQELCIPSISHGEEIEVSWMAFIGCAEWEPTAKV